MRQVIWAVVYASVLSLGVAGIATAAPQGNQQQKCINKINKGASKVQAAQGKANSGCIKDSVLKVSRALGYDIVPLREMKERDLALHADLVGGDAAGQVALCDFRASWKKTGQVFASGSGISAATQRAPSCSSR